MTYEEWQAAVDEVLFEIQDHPGPPTMAELGVAYELVERLRWYTVPDVPGGA